LRLKARKKAASSRLADFQNPALRGAHSPLVGNYELQPTQALSWQATPPDYAQTLTNCACVYVHRATGIGKEAIGDIRVNIYLTLGVIRATRRLCDIHSPTARCRTQQNYHSTP